MTGIAFIASLAALVSLGAILALITAADASIRLISRSRTRRLVDADVMGASALDRLVERPSRVAAALALWRGVAYSATAATLAWAGVVVVESDLRLGVALAGAGAGALLLFTVGEALPRTLAVQNPERVGLASAPLASKAVVLLSPVARFLTAGWVGLASLVARDPVTDAWLTGDEYGGETGDEEDAGRNEAEERFFDAVVDFANTIVREVMVPRTDMVCLEDIATVPQAVAVIAESGFSRLPVFHDTVDDIKGVLFAKDLLACVSAADCPPSVEPMIREAYFVPETKSVDELLLEMRERKTHMALVADEYGGTAGLVTIEDLLEEIVGEIFDEYDRAVPMVTELEDGGLLLDARLPIDDFNDLLGTAIDIEADSIGGLFVELAGHIPHPGEEIDVEGVRLTARDVEGTRIRTIHVRPSAEADREGPDAEAHHGG